jgi:hypothetical protein
MAEEQAPEQETRPDAKETAEATQPDAKAAAPVVEQADAQPEGGGKKPAEKAAGKTSAKAAPADKPQPAAEPVPSGTRLRSILKATPSWLVSMVVHIVVLLVLAVLTLPPQATQDLRELVIAPGDAEELEDLNQLDDPLEEIDVTTTDLTVLTTVEPEVVDVTAADDIQSAAVMVELSDIGLEHAPKNDLLASVGAYSGDATSGRGEGKARMVVEGGGNDDSEKAVAAALRWLAAHQLPDGGWSFNHNAAPKCHGQCKNPGEMADARNAATGLALLPFLGAGQTHKTGAYRETVKGGLYFLVNRMKVSPQGGSLYEEGGRMYAHGICAIALCEAYAMTHDKGLYAPAQQAVNFICSAQDPVGGGWRYTPRQAGDTSVVGWQIMALKSGHMAYLNIPPITVKKAFTYLDTVQANNGANYGYTDPGSGEATTAIGLLCRMYLGWKKDNPALERGVRWIGDRGPSKNNVYYNYYATQVMRHWEGELWDKWNNVMRDQLVNSQSKNGHETGSWYTGDNHGSKGGRLYCTSMCTMVLEVYYRHLPIYGKQSTEEDFPLD